MLFRILFNGRAFVLAFATVVAWIVIGAIRIRAHTRKIAAARTGEDFNTFRAAFQGEDVPEEVLRTVYEKFQEWCAGDVENFPVRASDSIAQIYGMVDDDLDDTILEILSTCGRRVPKSPDEIGLGPVPVKIRNIHILIDQDPDLIYTVGDLVRKLAACPKDEGSG